jgi:predicted PurR-regulated permease PerM
MLHQVLLPFVAGMVLAYLLVPLANRIERLGSASHRLHSEYLRSRVSYLEV